ncbi:cobalamin-dependent protein [Myxococcota bacterium]|nr:cobalamin-dependent protein [Myxococcota bacterium]
MNHRLDALKRSARKHGPRIGILSTWDVENNAVRILAATLRAQGHHVAEIYFKDWISNHLDPATDVQLQNLVRVIREEELDLLAISIRASAYAQSARTLTEHVQRELDIPVLWGGMHPTLVPDECIEVADMVLRGEGELALLQLADRLRDGSDDLLGTENVNFRLGQGEIVRNGLRPLIEDLDALQFRDYTTHDHKYFIWGNRVSKGDPMHGDPVFQMMGSRGCIYKCSYCYNSTYKKDVYPGQKWFRVRSPRSMVEEIRDARTHWNMKRIRFDDEVFNFQMGWLEEFCDLYPKEVGLPFEVFIEPKLVNETRMTMLRDAGLSAVYMGIQSSERVTGHLYDRRVKNQSIADIAQLYHRLGIKPHFQLIFDDPVSTEEDKRKLFEMISTFPHPYDLYLFSMTVFPGSELNHKLLETGLISDYDIDGLNNTRIFYQHRVNLAFPRPVEDTFWIALTQMLSKPFVPRSLLRLLAKSETLKQHPLPLIHMAHAANYVKMGTTAARMAANGEMTSTLMRRWLSFDRVITT